MSMYTPCAIFYRNCSPYHLARLRAAAREVPGIVAIEIVAHDLTRPWRPAKENLGFPLRTLFQRPFEDVSYREQCQRTADVLKEIEPATIMVVGYSDKIMRYLAVWAKNHGVPCIMTTDTTGRDKPRTRLKEILKAWWCKRYFDAMFLPGERSVVYFTELGFPEEKIWRGVHVVDIAFLESGSSDARSLDRECRRSLNLPDHYFLTVARLSEEKNIHGLLRAFREYRQKGGPWDLVVVGSGPQQENLRSCQREQEISGVHFVDWKQYEDLPPYFGLASCFVLPSISEPWGVVVNEALACGLPVLVSRQCGCVPELCRRGVNGYDFDPHNTEELTNLMLRFSSGELDLESMGQASRRIASNFTLETWSLTFKDCIATMLKTISRKPLDGSGH